MIGRTPSPHLRKRLKAALLTSDPAVLLGIGWISLVLKKTKNGLTTYYKQKVARLWKR